ncbi:MAG: alpha-(1-_3)-arabinofuranosyltransferase family protein [Patescibacteria group bacterium]|nr:alpha-(1->3)-arabinofuranosyltransferase family protein [Patescibacteria group bacterium]
MKKKTLFEFIIIFILGLIPLLWFHGDQIILGHDSGLTLFPISHFTDRLYAWTQRIGFGNDQTYAIPGFFIHGLDALVSSLGFKLQSVQKIVFIFWFVLPGLTMYYFASSLSKKLKLKYFALPVAIFYMFNHFLLQGWFVAERTKFSVYAALPLIMTFLFDWEEKRRSTLKTALYISLTIFFLNGEAGLPLFGGLFLSVFVFIIFYFIKEFSLQRLLKVIKLFVIIFAISVLLNAYWLLPYGGYLLQSYASAVAQAGGLNGVLGWLNYVSQDSSFINIFRLQGIPEWYLNPSHPYANIFLRNIFLIAVSFLIPAVAFLPLYLVRNGELRKKIIFFSFLALFSMFFIAGSHPPLGAIYVFLINFLPGFIAFRNPLYKFAPALWFSYAILIGFTINHVLQRIETEEKLKKIRLNSRIFSYVFYFTICIGIILYSFPFLSGSFFDYIKGERSMRVNVPQYIFDFGKWSESKERLNTKVLALPPVNPDNKIDAYTWGYWSLSSLTSLLTNAPIINESNYMSKDEISLIETLYKMIKNDDPGWKNLAKLLGIKSFLLRKDFTWNLKGSPTDNPSIYEKTLKNSDLSMVKKFGSWEVYDFGDDVNNNIITSSRVNYLVGDVTDLGKVASLPFFNSKEPVYVPTATNHNSEDILKIRNELFLVPSCVYCNLQHKFINTDLFTSLITRGSIFYPLIELKNKFTEKKITSIPEKVNFYLYSSLRSILVFDKLVSEKRDFNLLLAEINDYGKSLNNLEESLKNYLGNKEDIDNDFLLDAAEVLGREKTEIFAGNSSNLSSGEILNSLNQRYNDLQRIKNEIDKNIWQTSDETNKKFLINSNTNAQFELLYRPKTSSSSMDEVNLILDDINYKFKTTQISEQWFSLGKIFLSKGPHRMSIEYPIKNLYTGSSSVKLNSSADASCFSSNRIKGQKNDIYRISFQHRRLLGSRKFFLKVLPADTKYNLLDTRNSMLDSTSIFDNYSTDYLLTEDESFYLTICYFPSTDKEDFVSSIELKDINIRKIAIPDVVFYNLSSSQNSSESKFDKISQTEYSVSLGSDNRKKAIVLGESYNKNWILENTKDNIKFTVNGYANGWIVNGDKQEVVIKYKLQDFVNFGFAISGVSFILSILYLSVISRKK